MSSHAVWDAVIVGGGPAGSALAIRLSRLGHRVLVIDRETFPRAKPCGECLSPAAVRELDRLSLLSNLLLLPHQRLSGWRIGAPSGRSFDGSFTAPCFGVAMRRSCLDAALLEEAARAGARIRTGERVADLMRDGDRVCGVRLGRRAGGEQIRARLVVGADGIRSVVMRRLGLARRAPRLRKVALTAHASGDLGQNGRGELHVTSRGCIGVAGVDGDTVNLTVVLGTREAAPLLEQGAERCFDSQIAAHPHFSGFRRVDDVLTTGPFDWPVRSAVADGAILVGDAAGYYDPFTGQGVYRALRGAALAAVHAHAALRADQVTRESLAGYERDRRRVFGPGERLQRLIEAVVSREPLMEAAAGTLNRLPRLADALVSVTADLSPVRSLVDPRLLARAA